MTNNAADDTNSKKVTLLICYVVTSKLFGNTDHTSEKKQKARQCKTQNALAECFCDSDDKFLTNLSHTKLNLYNSILYAADRQAAPKLSYEIRKRWTLLLTTKSETTFAQNCASCRTTIKYSTMLEFMQVQRRQSARYDH